MARATCDVIISRDDWNKFQKALGVPMNLEQLVGVMGYAVFGTSMLPYDRTNPDGTVERVSYIVDDRARCVWMGQGALAALREATNVATLKGGA